MRCQRLFDLGPQNLGLLTLGLFLLTAPLYAGTLELSSTLDSSAPAPTTVQFDYSASPDDLVSWLWTFGDGSSSSAPRPSHAFTLEGAYTVRLDAISASQGPISAELPILVYNHVIEDDFEDSVSTMASWLWPEDRSLLANFTTRNGSQMLGFPILRGVEPQGGGWGPRAPLIDTNEADLICIEPIGGGGDDETWRRGVFRFDLLLESESLPAEAKMTIFRILDSNVELLLQYVGGSFEMRIAAGGQLTAWEPLLEGSVYSIEVDLIGALDQQAGEVTVSWASFPTMLGYPAQSLTLIDPQILSWSGVELGAFDVQILNGPPAPAANVGLILMDNVRFYRHTDPESI